VLLDSQLLEQNRALGSLGVSIHWTVVSAKLDRQAAHSATYSLKEVDGILKLSSESSIGIR
jgi:hypothetical protein